MLSTDLFRRKYLGDAFDFPWSAEKTLVADTLESRPPHLNGSTLEIAFVFFST